MGSLSVNCFPVVILIDDKPVGFLFLLGTWLMECILNHPELINTNFALATLDCLCNRILKALAGKKVVLIMGSEYLFSINKLQRGLMVDVRCIEATIRLYSIR